MVLEDFQNYMMSRDPDIIVGTANVEDRTVIQHLFTGVRELELDMQLGGEPSAV